MVQIGVVKKTLYQDCANPENFNDRKLVWGSEDIVVNACFGLCGDGVCADLVPPTFVEVTFNVDANAYNEQQGFVGRHIVRYWIF